MQEVRRPNANGVADSTRLACRQRKPVGRETPAHRPPWNWQAITLDRCSDADAPCIGRWVLVRLCTGRQSRSPKIDDGAILRSAYKGCQRRVSGIVHWALL